MSEKEKMLAGKLYEASNPELTKEREIAKDQCFLYNQIKPSNERERKKVIQTILGKTKEHFVIEQPFLCDYGYLITIGENFYSNHHLVILDAGMVEFGDHVLIGPNCGFYTSGHPLELEQRRKGLEYAKPIKVGNDVWIGGNVIVLPGVTIGDHTIIGAGSVVNKDIPSGVVAVGNPCQVIKKLNVS